MKADDIDSTQILDPVIDPVNEQEILEATLPGHLGNIASNLAHNDKERVVQLIDSLLAQLKEIVPKDEHLAQIEWLLLEIKERQSDGAALVELLELLNDAKEQIE